MKSTRTFLQLFAVAVVAQASHAQDAGLAPAWPHERSDIKPDASVVWGKLENGFRYAILPNNEPPKRVSVRLVINTGSLMEEDSQQGLAHFLEHMAFNGTKHFAAGEMKAYFQRLKMGFGADTNAHTSFKETVYKLELPEGTDAYFKDALTLMRDYADGMLLQEKEIEAERGVILSEKLARDSVEYRTMVEGFKFSLPESLIPRRLPIGEDKIIKTAPQERFTAYYQKWYTADRMTLVVVGDVKAPELAAKIKEAFGSLKTPAQALPDPDFGKVSGGHGLQAKLHTEKEAGEVNIGIEAARPSRRRPDTVATRAESLVRSLADSMLNRRFEKLGRKENSPILNAEADNEDFLEFVESSVLQLTCKPEQWQQALAACEQELRSAIKFGFSEAEFQEAKANLLTELENEASQAPKRQSRNLADEMAQSLGMRKVFTHPADDLVRVKGALEKVSAAQCHEALAKDWASEDIRIFVGGNLSLENGDARVKEAFLASRKTEVHPPAEEKQGAFAYANFGAPGKIVKREEIKDLGLTLVTFENNVRLNLKPTDFAKDTILVNAQWGGGRLASGGAKPGIQFFANAVFEEGALEKHSADELEQVLAGRTASVTFGIGDEFFSLSGKTNRKDLPLQFQLLCAQMTAPGYREEGLRQLRLGLDAIFTQITSTPEGMLQTQLPALLRGNDPRFLFGKKEEIKALTMADLKGWLAEALAGSFVEIGVVGDFDVDAAIAAAASTFGAIPARPAQRPEYADLRAVGRTTEKSTTLTFASKLPKAAALVVWPTTDRRSNITRSRHSNLLASILGDLVEDEVREKLGESYSPDVHSLMSDTFTGDGAITAILLCKGELAAELSKIVKEIAAKLAVTGATQDQLERARGPLLKMLEEQKRNNIWWLNTIISQAQSSPQRIEWARTLADEYSKASLDDINKLAKEYLTSDRAIDIEIIPEGTKQAAIPAPSATGAKKENGNGKEKEKTKEKPKAGAAAGAK